MKPSGLKISISIKSYDEKTAQNDQMGVFPSNDMQTPPPSFDPVFIDDAQCAETNEKSIFRFSFFE